MPTILDLADISKNERLAMDGESLIELLADTYDPERTVFSEYHVEKVKGPSFMVRRGKYKYVYVHEFDSQLFDLEADPGEWHNLSGLSEVKELEAELHALILAQFDPDRLTEAGQESVRRRKVIREALQRNDVHWDYQPDFDATRQYVR